MLNNCFKAPRSLARLRCGPAKPYLDDFITWLESQGYRCSTIRHHVHEVVQFTNLIEAEGLPVRDLDRSMLARLCRDLAEPSSLQYPSGSPRKINHSARLFVNFLAVDGDVALCSSNASTKGPPLLLEFREWMRAQRGTMDTTLKTYRLPIIELLNDLGTDPSTFDAHGLRKFLLRRVNSLSQTRAKNLATAVRMFLRFLIAQGRCAPALEHAIPPIARWRLSSLPKYLPAQDVERLINSCDPSSPMGQETEPLCCSLHA